MYLIVLLIMLSPLMYALPTCAQTVTFSAVGDVFFGRGGKEFGTEDPFRYVKDEFLGRDIVLGNLETPIAATRNRITTPPCTLKKHRKNSCKTDEERRYRRLYFLTFQARISAARLLKEGGFTVVSTANNHAEDQGGEGIRETLVHLAPQSVSKVGSGKSREEAWAPYIFEKDGVSVGIIAATTILNFTPVEGLGFVAHGTVKQLADSLPRRIAALKTKVDFVVVTLHYGAESERQPSPRERNLIRVLAAAGTDLFIGTHPHVLRGIEIIGKTVVFWSLGNFLFDAPRADWRDSAIVHVDFVKNKTETNLKNIRLVPVTLSGDPSRLPQPASPEKAAQIISDVKRFSRVFQNPKKSVEFSNDIIRVNLP